MTGLVLRGNALALPLPDKTVDLVVTSRSGPQARRVIGYLPVDRSDWREGVTRTITGYKCACTTPDAPTRPAVVLDPFGGTGTTAMVANALGRTGISLDMSADYSRLAQWRTQDRAQHANIRGETFRKPEPVPDGQGDLFAGGADREQH